ncbi:FAS1 domain-containing protein [Lepidopterella palustris CBS 459.81]|uniref:FAS1 domain-containing protein n=1 Tax=Lepidopterella palustris CBS 459.81 TaxID=1314670 RepID=A0A8E2EBD2_9PEZI|nr:FAS1 domain-containing protein [Lepidopterella palustris CBS 459.81]
MFHTLIALGLSLSFLLSSSLADSTPSFKDVLSSTANLSTFLNTLQNSYPDLLAQLNSLPSSSPVTILAPNNDAFAKTVYYPVVGPAFSNGDEAAIQNILIYHVVNGSHSSKDLLPTFQYFPTWLSNATFANVTGGQRVGGVLQNGKEVIFTSGQSTRSRALQADIAFAGGIIHIIDTLVTPPTSFPQTAELFDTTTESFQLTSFLGATYYSPNKTVPALAALLNSTSDVTIFAPNNAALEVVNGALADLAKNPSALAKLLDYHIVVGNGGPWYSTNLTNATTLTTLAGETITITSASNSLFVNSARMLTSDLLIVNGVMHVLDNVLSPDDTSATPVPSLATQVPVLSQASGVKASEAPFTTFMPWNVVTILPAAAATSGGKSGYGQGSATTGYGAQATGTGKVGGGAGRVSAGAMGVVGMVVAAAVML